MIPTASGGRIWLATGHTDMRRGMQGLALLVQEGLGRNPFICVGGEYVAAQFRPGQFRGDDELCRHIISDVFQ